MRRIAVAFVLLLSCFAGVTPTSMADIAGDGAVHSIDGAGKVARMIIFVCPATNTSTVRIGDATISATVGLPCAPGGSLTLPALPRASTTEDPNYQLSAWFYLIQTGDKLSITRFNQQ